MTGVLLLFPCQKRRWVNGGRGGEHEGGSEEEVRGQIQDARGVGISFSWVWHYLDGGGVGHVQDERVRERKRGVDATFVDKGRDKRCWFFFSIDVRHMSAYMLLLTCC